jgi:ATP-dependent exoDNAse (exonuclease V) beta subunit
MYVAMTRAVHALHMILPPAKPGEGNLPRTYAGLLRATLAPASPAAAGALLYEHGNRDWHLSRNIRESAAAASVAAEMEDDEDELPLFKGLARKASRPLPASVPPKAEQLAAPDVASARPILAPPLPRRDRGLERVSPSLLEGGSKLPAARLIQSKTRRALEYGTLVHAWLQEIGWLEDGLPDDALLTRVANRLAGSLGHVPGDLSAPLAEFRKQLTAPAIAAVLSKSFYAGRGEVAIARERRFAVRLGDRLISGSIDRLAILSRGGKTIAADVLDFKTDDLAASDAQALADKVAFYQPQLHGYRQSIAQELRLPLEQVSAHLVFLKPGLVKRVE